MQITAATRAARPRARQLRGGPSDLHCRGATLQLSAKNALLSANFDVLASDAWPGGVASWHTPRRSRLPLMPWASAAIETPGSWQAATACALNSPLFRRRRRPPCATPSLSCTCPPIRRWARMLLCQSRHDQNGIAARLQMNVAQAFKNEIARVARKEVRSEIQSLKRSSVQYRTDIAALKRKATELKRLVGQLHKVAGKVSRQIDLSEPSTPGRFSAELQEQMRGFVFITLLNLPVGWGPEPIWSPFTGQSGISAFGPERS